MLAPFRSGVKVCHSPETALLKVTGDLLLTLDSGNGATRILFDLCAAFDTVDHRILLVRREHWVGIEGIALSWFHSFLQQRTFSVS